METEKIISIILAIASFGLLFFIGIKTDLLKEEPGKPYSFRKFQLWIWTMVICPAFSLNWGYHADTAGYPTLNETGLVLLGIAGATTAFGEMIAATHKTNLAAPSKARLLPVSFWSDILRDDNGQFSLGRLQQLIFTFVYVTIFICRFFTKMDYPDFGPNAYILMGISSGTYLVGKGMTK